MRTNDERLAALHKRAGEIDKENRKRRVRLIQFASCAACFLLVIGLALWMPVTEGTPLSGGTGSMSASIFSGSGYLGYIVIGIVAFLLGCAVTVFCFRLRKWQKDKENEDDAYDRND